jgi:hypothetical protein
MNDPKLPRPGSRPGITPASTPAAAGANPKPDARSGASATGKVVHDERGNAVWDWVKQTSRIAIESTSRVLRRLETPELKVESTKDEELRITPDPSAGGGHDPYNQRTKPPGAGHK